jgi:hypothetical protein
MLYWQHYHARAELAGTTMRAPIIGLVCALVALVPVIWRPDPPLLYVTVFMRRLRRQRCRRQSQCGRGHKRDSLSDASPRDKASLTMPSSASCRNWRCGLDRRSLENRLCGCRDLSSASGYQCAIDGR